MYSELRRRMSPISRCWKVLCLERGLASPSKMAPCSCISWRERAEVEKKESIISHHSVVRLKPQSWELQPLGQTQVKELASVAVVDGGSETLVC